MPHETTNYAGLRDGPILVPFPAGYLLDVLASRLSAFFALGDVDKRRHVVDAAPGQSGYSPPMLEGDPRQGHGDWKEMWNWASADVRPQALSRTIAQAEPSLEALEEAMPGVAELLPELDLALSVLRREICNGLAAVLRVEAGYLHQLLTHGPHLTRAINYLPLAGAGAGAEWAREHIDISLFTVVLFETDQALECVTPDGWRPASVPQGFALLKAGKMLEILSNGEVPAVRHRVIARNRSCHRLSLIHFAQPAGWFIIGPLPSCVSVERPLRFPAMRAVDTFRRELEVAGILGERNFER